MTTKFTAAKQDKFSTPLPLEKEKKVNENCNRIWIGNVDPLVTEFSLLQLLQKFGKIKEFDFLIHKTGPWQGKSRGFHFATYFSKCEAEMAIKHLNGKRVLSKHLSVHWADQHEKNEKSRHVNINLNTDLVSDNVQCLEEKAPKLQRKKVINSIEKKLREMQDSSGCSSTATSRRLHPLLQKSKTNETTGDIRKRLHPYQTFYKKKR